MKNLVILFIFIVVYLPVNAQIKVQGKVTDVITKEALPLAVISVTDTLQVNAIVFSETDEKGDFEIIIPKSFTSAMLTVKYLGYATFSKVISINTIPEKLQIVLHPSAKMLEEITVNAKQKAVTISGDKIVYNIERLGAGNGNSGLETVRQIPGVRLDKDDNIQFRGSSDVQIMVNGRKSLLQGDALREFIRSLKGNDIQSVEVIAQPSARYDAAGTTGIINIVLKKNKAAGITGNVYSSVAYAEYFKNHSGAQLFYNDSLWNINANGYYYDGNSVNHRRVSQTIQLEEGIRTIDQTNEWLPRTISKNLNFGAERKLSEHSLMSTEWQYFKENENADTYGVTNEYLNGQPTNNVRLTQFIASPSKRITGNLFYNYTADSTATKLDAQVNYAHYESGHNGFQRNDYSDALFMQLDGRRNTVYDIINGQVDFNRQLTKKTNLEVGVKYSYVNMDYFNAYTTNNESKLLIPDSLLVNDFTYKEHLASGYAQYAVDLEKWNFMAGLRAEYYTYDATSGINHKTNTANFLNWFPSFSASYKNQNNQYQVSYSRRIGRPAYLALNPYYQYIDAYTLELGNPDLKPQLYHSFQLSYIYKSALNISMYGYLYDKGFTSVINYLEEQNYNLTYQANASKGNRFGISASLPYEPFDWWTMQLSLDGAYSYEKSDITDFSYSGGGYNYDISLYENFRLKYDWNLTLNGFYNGRSTSANGYTRATYDFSLSAKKFMFDKKLQLLFGCNNILKKSFYSQVTNVDNVSTDWTNRWETRRFYFQVIYYFGGGKTKKVKSTSLGDEMDRI